MAAADEIVIVFAISGELVEVLVQSDHERLRLVADGLIRIDKLVVIVAQERAQGGETGLKVKERRAPAQERFKIAVHARGEKLAELCQQLTLAADPFQKRLRWHFRRETGKRCGFVNSSG